jgi:cytidyltransferase-like protein
MTMPQVVVTGDFDNLRSEEFRFLQEAARLGELTVLLQSDESIRSATGKSPKFPYAERHYFLQALRYVSGVSKTDATDTASLTLKEWKPDTWVVHEKDDSAKKQAFCDANRIEYRVIRQDSLKGFPLPAVIPQEAVTTRKKVLVTGCYDWFHSGHVRFFEEVSELGDLYVVVGSDVNLRLLKGEGHPMFPQDERVYMAGSVRYVKQALISSGSGWMDAEPEIARIKPDIYAVNEDGDKPEKSEFSRNHGLQYVVLKRTPKEGLPRRQSTDLRRF